MSVDPLFLDANASALVLPGAKEALINCLDVRGNPSSPHAMGRRKRRILDEAREHVAKAMGCLDKEVFFTSGATEAIRFASASLVEEGRHQGKKLRVWTSPLEHPAVEKNLEAAHAKGEIDLVKGEVTRSGVISFAEVSSADAIFCTAAHNETGILLDTDALCEVVTDDAIVCIDASQAVARLPALPPRVDMGLCSAHKLGGVSGCGAFFLRGNAKQLSAGWTGGGQEQQLRPGTEATALISAMGAACADIQHTRTQSLALAIMRDELESFVIEKDPFDDVTKVGLRIIGIDQPRLPQTSAIAFSGVGPEALRMWADRCGLAVGFGSACSALAPHASTALLSLGLDEKTARSTMRLSLDVDTTAELIDEAKVRLAKLVHEMSSRRR